MRADSVLVIITWTPPRKVIFVFLVEKALVLIIKRKYFKEKR